MLSASGNLFKCHEEVLYLQPLIPPKRFDIFPPITGGCSEGLYNHINLPAGLTEHRNNRHEKLGYNSTCYIGSRIGWVSMKEVYKLLDIK